MQEFSDNLTFTKPWFLQQIFIFASLQSLLLRQALLNKSAYQVVNNPQFLRIFLQNMLRLEQKSNFSPSQETKAKVQTCNQILNHPPCQNLKDLAKLTARCKIMKRAPPVQLFGYRSTLGHDHEYTDKYEVYNLGTGDFSKSFCSEKPGPGCFSLIPYVYNNLEYQQKAKEYLKVMQKDYQWYLSLYAPQQLIKFKQKIEAGQVDQKQRETTLLNYASKMKLQKQQTKIEASFHKWLQECESKLLPVLELTKQPKIVKGADLKGCEHHEDNYDLSSAYQAMKDLQLVLFGFYLKLSHGYSCNLKTFAVVLHDDPIPVESTHLFCILSEWKQHTQVTQFLESQNDTNIRSEKIVQTEQYFVHYFKHQPRSQKVRLLCWAQTHQKIGDFYFQLPQIECTRFMTIVGIDHHNHCSLPAEETNIDIRKFMGAGFLISTHLL